MRWRWMRWRSSTRKSLRFAPSRRRANVSVKSGVVNAKRPTDRIRHCWPSWMPHPLARRALLSARRLIRRRRCLRPSRWHHEPVWPRMWTAPRAPRATKMTSATKARRVSSTSRATRATRATDPAPQRLWLVRLPRQRPVSRRSWRRADASLSRSRPRVQSGCVERRRTLSVRHRRRRASSNAWRAATRTRTRTKRRTRRLASSGCSRRRASESARSGGVSARRPGSRTPSCWPSSTSRRRSPAQW
mmetsp:Transcript_5857/g.14944  ORF Transcript_5857/g.14944 Transcript_5857/m.14944 type:complete len:246 (+) Transcript_5857:1229-1966(+)